MIYWCKNAREELFSNLKDHLELTFQFEIVSRKESSLLVPEKLAAFRLISYGGVKLIKKTSRCNYVCEFLKVRDRSLSFKNHTFKANIFIRMLLFYNRFGIFLRMLHRKTQFEDSVTSSHLRNIVGRIREQYLQN